MGGKFSVEFHQNDEIPGQGAVAAQVFENILLSKKDIDKLFTAFDDLDEDGSGSVKMDEFFSFFRLETTQFNVELFRIFDCDGNGELTFLEFVCVVWNFLTLNNTALGNYIVYIYCGSVSGRDIISSDEIINMIKLIHGENVFSHNEAINGVMKEVKNGDQDKSIHELAKWMHDNPMMTNPIRVVYANLRVHLIGTRFWNRLSKVRANNPYLKPINYVIDMADELELQDLEAKMKKEYDEIDAKDAKKRVGPASLGVRRVRRGSLLAISRSGKNGDQVNDSEAFGQNYQSKRKHKKPETTDKNLIVRPRRQSLSKALSFVRGIGSSKSKKLEPPPAESVSGGKGRYNAKRGRSIKLIIDTVKSLTSSKSKEENTDNTPHKKKKRNKSKIKRVDAKQIVPDSSAAYELGDSTNNENTESATTDGGWKDAVRHY